MKELADVNKPVELARLLNVSEQVVTNWKSRGIAKDKLIDLADEYAFRIKYVLTGEGDMLRPDFYHKNSARKQVDLLMQELPEYKQQLAVKLLNSLAEPENGTTDN